MRIKVCINTQKVKKYFCIKNFLYFSIKKVNTKNPTFSDKYPKVKNRNLKLPLDQIKNGTVIVPIV